MKTTTYLFTLLFFSVAYGAEQLSAGLMPIFNDIVDVINTPKFEYDLEIFLQSETALLLKDALDVFSPEDKNRLMEKVHNLPGGDFMRHRRRNFLAAIIQAGGDIDANLDKYNMQTFLGDCVLHDDTEGVTFALKHNANQCLEYGKSQHSIVSLARTYEMASRLIEHHHYTRIPEKPLDLISFLKANEKEQYDLLVSCMYDDRSAKILDLYLKKGLNLKLRDDWDQSLLHRLCCLADSHKESDFFSKFQTLLEADAIDLDAVSYVDGTPMDIINESRSANPTIELARGLIQSLENNPRFPRGKKITSEELSHRKRTLAKIHAEFDEAWWLTS